MNFSRRDVLGLLAVGALAGCSGSDPTSSDGGSGNTGATATPTGQDNGGGLPDDGSDDGSETSLAGSCASNFGETLQPYDVGDRGMVATFSYPMGGEITFEQDNPDNHVTAFGYGRGSVSPLHTITVSESGPSGTAADATVAMAFDDRFENSTVTTLGGQELPTAIRRTEDESVTYIFNVERSDGVYSFSVVTAAGNEGEPCLDTYESVTRQVAESFEPVA